MGQCSGEERDRRRGNVASIHRIFALLPCLEKLCCFFRISRYSRLHVVTHLILLLLEMDWGGGLLGGMQRGAPSPSLSLTLHACVRELFRSFGSRMGLVRHQSWTWGCYSVGVIVQEGGGGGGGGIDGGSGASRDAQALDHGMR